MNSLRHSPPGAAGGSEKRFLRELPLSSDDRQFGALPKIWWLQAHSTDGTGWEEALHD